MSCGVVRLRCGRCGSLQAVAQENTNPTLRMWGIKEPPLMKKQNIIRSQSKYKNKHNEESIQIQKLT
jgi:hypothetical protein